MQSTHSGTPGSLKDISESAASSGGGEAGGVASARVSEGKLG